MDFNRTRRLHTMKHKLLGIIYIVLSLIMSFIIFSFLPIDLKWWITLAISLSFIYTYLKSK